MKPIVTSMLKLSNINLERKLIMSNKFYLIQRGSFRNNFDTATGLLGGRPDRLIDPDYMGSAEFEWGAIPRAYRRILGQFDKYSLHITDLVTTGGVPFCLYCRDDRYEIILDAIKKYLKEDYRLKEWTNMGVHFKPTPTDEWLRDHYKYQLRTNFWWCIDVASISNDDKFNHVGDWIAFTGATDRQKAFTRIINQDYSTWWTEKPESEREEEFKESFSKSW